MVSEALAPGHPNAAVDTIPAMAAPDGTPGDQAEPPIALVTGANKGIGLAIAKGLGRRRFVVLAGARDVVRGHAAVCELQGEGVDAIFIPLDITDGTSVSAAARSIEERFGQLDVLVNNAAVKLEWHPSAPSRASLDVVRETYETNVFGTMAVIQAMLPLLRRSPAARIVNLSSGLGSITLAATEGTKYHDRPLLSYNTSKAAVNSLTVQFANELAASAIKVNAADPGYTNTDMTKGTGARTPEDAAGVVIRLATLPDDGPTGGFFDEHGRLPW
jgi:NAD(P)-dependent dehydrogenase (short-subunit alcohol dehydrogenase family)